MKTREPLFYIAVGKKGIGKTFESTKLIDNYVKGNEVTGFKPRKVLIMDVNNEFIQYKKISPDDVIKFAVHPKIECRRISVLKPDGYPMSLDEMADTSFKAIKQFRGGLFVMEDISKYVSDTLQKDIIGTLATSRHIDTDIIAHFQFIGKVGNPKIKSTMNMLRFHKIGDSVETHKDKFQEYTEILKIAEAMVNKSFDYGMKMYRGTTNVDMQKQYFDKYCRFFCYVDFDKDQIKGNFSKQQFIEAITDYIMYNPKQTVDITMKLKDPNTGKSIHTYATALSFCREELFEKYYGNY
jgi:ribosomal protein L30/L7E